MVGALLLSQLQISGTSRPEKTFYIYVDEVQKFVTTSLGEMFSEARKFGLSLTVAHQFLGQFPRDMLEAILGNVGASIIFQCSPMDARALNPYVQPQFKIEHLTNLDKYHAAVKMQYQGKTQPTFTLKTIYPFTEMSSEAVERVAYIRDLSQKPFDNE